MSKLYNLARMTTATTGTGTITLGSAVSGYLTFALAGVQNGDTVSYGIKDGSNSEVGTGTYTSAGTTLTRTVTKSTNSNSAISLSGAAEVYITMRAEDVLLGSSTNDNAAAGYIGELIESSVTSVSITSGVQTNVTSISLTAGDWDVWANLGINGTSTSSIGGAITTTSATLGSGPNGGAFYLQAGDQAGGFAPIGQRRLSLSTATTVYLVTKTTGTGTLSANGYLGARRRR